MQYFLKLVNSVIYKKIAILLTYKFYTVFDMSEQETQESSKTVVSFTVGLIVGGLLVWVFSGSPEQAPTEIILDDAVKSSENLQIKLKKIRVNL